MGVKSSMFGLSEGTGGREVKTLGTAILAWLIYDTLGAVATAIRGAKRYNIIYADPPKDPRLGCVGK